MAGFNSTVKRRILIIVNTKNHNSFELKTKKFFIDRNEEKTVANSVYKQWRRKVA